LKIRVLGRGGKGMRCGAAQEGKKKGAGWGVGCTEQQLESGFPEVLEVDQHS